MAHQIVYTSAPRGLTPGSKGYCTVVASNAMASALQRQLESLSQYNHIYPPNTTNDILNPTNFQYSKASFGGKQLCVLSRVSDAGLDYSRRSNLLAHHVALESDECNVSGPAALIDSLLLPPSVKRWEKPPQRLDMGAIRNPPCPTSPMTSHHPLGLRPELVGEIAGRLANSTQQIVTVLYRQEQHAHLLPLVIDVFWLLAPRERWNITFSTYYFADLKSTDCRLRFIPHGTPNAERVMLERDTIDLNQNMTVLDSEMVKAAREAAKTGNRTLAHPRAAESVHPTGDSFARAQLKASTPRLPIGGPELHLQPPPIAQPVTQAPSNQDSHKKFQLVQVSEHSRNQDGHNSGVRKKLVIAISVVTTFLLLGIIATVVLNNAKIGSSDSVTHSKKSENGNNPKNGNDAEGEKGEGEKGENSKKGNPQHGSDANKPSNMGETKDPSADGNKGMNPEDGGKGNGENVKDMIDTPLKTGTKTEYKVHLKNRDILYVDHQTLITSQEFDRKIYDDQDRFSKIREKRISLRQSPAAHLQISQTDEGVNEITLGLKPEDDQKLLDIKLTDDPKNQLVFKWREEIDPARKSDLKEKLSAELMKTVLLVPYFLEETSESHQKVRMCVVAFGSMNDSPIEKPAFPEHGIYSLSLKDSSVFARAIDSVSASDNSTIKVTANLPKYNAQVGHIQVNKILDANEEKTEFNSQSFWQNGVGISEYKPEISFFLKTLTDEVQYGFRIKEIKYQGPNDKESSFEVFKYLNAISNSDKDKYLWDPEKHEQKVTPNNASANDKAKLKEENDLRKRNAKSFHQTYAIELGKDFLEVMPTSSYQVAPAMISQSILDEWIKGAVKYGTKDLAIEELEKLKTAKRINEQMFRHLPDVNKLKDGAHIAIDDDKIFTNNEESKEPLQIDENRKEDLNKYKIFCKNHLEQEKLEPMKLEQITKDLTNWAETLHGLSRINQNLKNGYQIQIQIEVQQSFKLPSTYGTDDNISMADNSIPEGQESDDLIVPIVRFGHVEAINN